MIAKVDSHPVRPPRVSKGFTLFEVIIAMFVVLMGLMGIIATFSVGMKAQVVAQELVVSQELATMWADWVRFRLSDNAGPSIPNSLKSTDLVVGASGNFYKDSGTFHIGAGNAADLPLYQKQLYQGYTWRIKRLVNSDGTSGGVHSYVPQWIPQNCTNLLDAPSTPGPTTLNAWNQRLDGGAIFPAINVQGLTQVELAIERGGREYLFNYTFSGVGLRY